MVHEQPSGDLETSRIKKYEQSMQAVVDLLESTCVSEPVLHTI